VGGLLTHFVRDFLQAGAAEGCLSLPFAAEACEGNEREKQAGSFSFGDPAD